MFDEVIAERVRPLAEALVRTDLAEVRVADAEVEIMVRRAPRVRAAAAAGAAAGASVPPAASPAALDVITADLVGRVRFPRPAVVEGSVLSEDRELAWIETLGIRNAIRSRGPGRVATVFVEEGQAVDYGHPLFAIDRSPR